MVLGSSAGVGAGVDLKDTDEVKDYVDNLGIEYRFGCYHEKDPKACHLLGDYWEGIKKNYAKAYKTYEINCLEYKHGHSCHKAAGYRYFGKACTKDGDMAYDFFKKGCELGYHSSCLSAGLLDTLDGNSVNHLRSVPPNPKAGLEFYRKACDDGQIAEGCYRYGAQFVRGVKDVCEKNMEHAFKYSVKACELGSLQGCTNVSIMYSKGEGVEKNPVAAKDYANIVGEMMSLLRTEQQQLKFGEGIEEDK